MHTASGGSQVIPCGQTDERTDMTKLIVYFRNFAKALNNLMTWRSSFPWNPNFRETFHVIKALITSTRQKNVQLLTVLVQNSSQFLEVFVRQKKSLICQHTDPLGSCDRWHSNSIQGEYEVISFLISLGEIFPQYIHSFSQSLLSTSVNKV